MSTVVGFNVTFGFLVPPLVCFLGEAGSNYNGSFEQAKNLIKIEQNWLNNIKNDYQETNQIPPYSQLDIDSLITQINQDTSE